MIQTKTSEEIHPWNWFGPADSKTLIVGTFPTAKHNWKYDFFCPNTANLFWKVLAKVADTDLKYFSGVEAVNERKKILEKIKAIVTDMGKKVMRNDESSLDEKLIAIEYMNIFQILEENSSIQKIIFTSTSGNVSATKWFSNFLTEQKILHQFPKDKKFKSVLKYGDREVQLVRLYSTSPRAANRISFDKLVEIYKSELLNL